MTETWIDRALARIAPQTALRRARARLQLEVVRSYDGAARDRRTAGWQTSGGSASAEIASGSAAVRNRSRDLVRNNPWAAKIRETLLNNLVGDGIASSPVGPKRWRQLWSSWQRQCDFDGLANWGGLQELAAGGMIESGDVLIRKIIVPLSDVPPGTVPLKLQVLEIDHLDESKSGLTDSGGEIDRGIEYDSMGRRVAYWLFDRHPGDMSFARSRSWRSARVPASDIIHLFERRRPGQDRGISDFAPVVQSLRSINEHFDTRLTRRKIENCLAAFVHSDDPDAELGGKASTTDPDGHTVKKMAPGMIATLPNGTGVTIADPSATAGFGEESTSFLRAASAGAGVMFEHMTGDFSQVNYSSYRAGSFEFQRRCMRRQWLLLIPRLIERVIGWFEQAAVSHGLAPARSADWTHQPPAFISVDPKKDAEANLVNLRMGKERLRSLVEAQGYNFEEWLEGWRDDLALIDQLVAAQFDGDPRKILKGASNGQDAPPPAGD